VQPLGGGGKTPVSPLAYAPEHCSLLHDVCAWGAVCYFTGTLTLTQDIVNSASGAIVYAGVCVWDCLTDIRQSLAAPRLISKSDAVVSGSSSVTSPLAVSGTCDAAAAAGTGLAELLRTMHSSLVGQLKSVLTHLQVTSLSPLIFYIALH